MRAGMVLLGLTLGVLWVVGLSYGATTWLVWLAFIAAIASLASVLVPEEMPLALRLAPFVISGALLSLWIVALAVSATDWLAWWTFAFGVAYLLLGAGASTYVQQGARRPWEHGSPHAI